MTLCFVDMDLKSLIYLFLEKEPFSSIIIKFATEKITQQLLCIN